VAAMQMASSPTTGDKFRHLIRSITGISLPASKVQMIDQRLRRRVVEFGLPDTESYLEKLLAGELPEDELPRVIDLITTNTTSFFREAEHFDFLIRHILPDRLSKARPEARKRFKLWSAASSEGAEAYTAAMVLEEARRKGQSFDYAILGTDISARMLQRATAAIYADDQLTTVPRDLVTRYFLRADDPSMAGKARIVPELRARTRFRHLNLMDKSYAVDRDVDVILLRNVLIYFDASDKEKVVDRLAGHIAKGGYLLVGHAESMVVRHPSLQQVKPTVFQKC
jgi:chemotaxis protein methyltransferase CheR